MIYIYDIESFRNYFAVTFKEFNSKEVTEYIIYKNRNDLDILYRFISNAKNDWFVGYNSYNYDDQVLVYIFNNYGNLCFESSDIITRKLFDLSMDIIDNTSYKKSYNKPFKSIDLMKVGNIMMKSLKLIAVNLEWHKIQDIPFDPNHDVTENELEILHLYNLNDVLITEELYTRLLDKIKLRWNISQKYNIEVISESDSGMANRLLEKLYSDKTGITISELKKMRTPRTIIPFETVVFDDISFETDELKKVYNSVIRYIYYQGQPFFKKNFTFDGVTYQLGVGGIHSKDEPAKYEVDENNYIIDADISSMYPTLIINNNLTPAHLGSAFIELYCEIRDRRLNAKKAGDINESDTLKITINSVFGKTLNENHWLYDPLVGLRTTINGQLYIMMLIEKLVTNGFKVISANTDGVLAIVPKNKKDLYDKICTDWCNKTKFELEFKEYKKYIRKDVNNYIAILPNGKTKEKGDFLQELRLQQGIDKPIISKGLYEYFVKGIKPETTILNCKNIFDFCIAKKIDDKFQNEYHYIDNFEVKRQLLQDTVRFYISKNGGQLYKVNRKFTDDMINYCVGYNVQILNDVNTIDIDTYNINYNYYIQECYKIIYQIEDLQLKLF